MKAILWILVALVVTLLAYIRLAPSDPILWHVDPSAAREPGMAGVKRTVTADLAALDAIAQAEPRLRVLAGSVGEGHITYIARTRVFGFPDYITVKATGAEICILSRLRFGQGDMGVNKARLDRWLRQL